MKLPVLVSVTWDDAHGTAVQIYAEEMHVPVTMQTVGWLVKKDKVGVSVACERYHTDNGGYGYRGHTFVPAGIVRGIKRLR